MSISIRNLLVGFFLTICIALAGFVGSAMWSAIKRAQTFADTSKKVIYGVRPEHLTLSDEGMPITVTVVEPTGSETQIIARHGSQTIVCIFRDRVLPKVGETITVAPDLSRVHLFSESTGRRLS